MTVWKITELQEYWLSNTASAWMLVRENEQGLIKPHVFPKMTLAARAIEYNVPEDDIDTLLDIVLHEPFLADPYEPHMVAGADPAIGAGLTTLSPVNRGLVRVGDIVGVTCHTADTVNEGRQAHLLRIEQAKVERATVVCSRRALLAPIYEHREHRQVVASVEHEFRNIRNDFAEAIMIQRRLKANR